jgi:spermidine export protein MdtI
MQNVEYYHVIYLIIATLLEIVANIFLKLSDGFKRIWLGALSLTFVLAAFTCFSQAVKGFDLSVAYALWGGFGVVATALAGLVFFGQQLNWRGWLGILTLILGMLIIKFA